MEKFDDKQLENVCVIVIKENNEITWATGFYIDKKSILTSSSCLWTHNEPKITARRLTEDMFFDLNVAYKDDSFGLAMLEVIGDPPSESFGKLVEDGTLRRGENVYTFANAPGYTAHYLDGYVSSYCPDIYIEDSILCKDYYYRGTDERLTYRKMGHFWHSRTLRSEDEDEDAEKFEEGLQSELVIIPCSDFCFCYACVGSPLFKLNGEIVGMFIESGSSEKIALHVSAIRKFISYAG